MILLSNVCVIRNKTTTLSIENLVLKPGLISAFIGSSGAGKTTLLRSIAQMAPYTGSITYNQDQLNTLSNKERAAIIGYIFQEFNLFTHLTALENCIDPQLIRGISHEHARQKAEELLESLGVYEQKNYYPKNLSGGQRQRVAIARALLLEPSILLLDEPTANLDPARSKKLFDTLRQLADKGMTLCFTSHDYATIMQADVIYLMEHGSIIAHWYTRSESMPENIKKFFE